MEHHIPFDLVIQILCRLPVESLIRFTCVCKQWSLEMKRKSFIQLQLQQSTKTDGLLVFDTDNDSELIVSRNIDCTLTRLIQIPEGEASDFFQFEGTCNGLLCFSRYEKIVVWNMFIGEHLVLPPSPDLVGIIGTSLDFSFVRLGIGYDPINDDYKVVKVFRTLESDYTIFYNLRSKSWGNFKRCNSYHGPSSSEGIYASGAVHWIVEQRQSNFILAYNINTEKQLVLQPPEKLVHTSLGRYRPNLGVVGEDLYICSRGYLRTPYLDIYLEIWVMKEYGVKESWAKLCKVFTPDYFWPDYCCFKNCYGEELLIISRDYFICVKIGYREELLVRSNDYFLFYNLRDLTCWRINPLSNLVWLNSYIYRPSLVRILD